MKHSNYKWPLQEAKNKFSQVAEEATLYGPQWVTKRGVDAVVVVSIEEYARLSRPAGTLANFLKNSPLAGVELETDRDPALGREVDL